MLGLFSGYWPRSGGGQSIYNMWRRYLRGGRNSPILEDLSDVVETLP